MSAGSTKFTVSRIAALSLVSLWLAGCTNTNNPPAPVSSAGGAASSSTNSGMLITPPPSGVKSAPQAQPIQPMQTQTIQPQPAPVAQEPVQTVNGRIVYNRKYGDIPKGSYTGGSTYTVKRGDTLFYIAWVTGNDFRDTTTTVVAPVTAPTTVSTTQPTASSTSTSSPISAWRWPTDGKVIENFSGAEGGNKGIDIAGSKGQAIVATADGRVVYAGNALRGYGNLIIIKHNDDYLSAYAHNDTMLVREQQEVKAGQKIATMGSGRSHLYESEYAESS